MKKIDLKYMTGIDLCSCIPCCDCPLESGKRKDDCEKRLHKFLEGKKVTLIIEDE